MAVARIVLFSSPISISIVSRATFDIASVMAVTIIVQSNQARRSGIVFGYAI